MDIEKTREYYANIKAEDLCQCEDCRNFYAKAKASYPAVASYLEDIGIDIEKPLELWSVSLGKDEKGGSKGILYPDAQYVVIGCSDDFRETEVSGVEISVTESHPVTDLECEHFVIEASSFLL